MHVKGGTGKEALLQSEGSVGGGGDGLSAVAPDEYEEQKTRRGKRALAWLKSSVLYSSVGFSLAV